MAPVKRGIWAIWWEFPRAVHARLLVVQRCTSPDGDQPTGQKATVWMLRCAIERCKKKYSSPLPKSVLGERWSLALKQSGKSLGKSRLVMLKVSWAGGFVQSINLRRKLNPVIGVSLREPGLTNWPLSQSRLPKGHNFRQAGWIFITRMVNLRWASLTHQTGCQTNPPKA